MTVFLIDASDVFVFVWGTAT